MEHESKTVPRIPGRSVCMTFGVAFRGARDQVAESFWMQSFGRAWEDKVDSGDGGEWVIS